jgi:4-aminobutyrate aminotransferase
MAETNVSSISKRWLERDETALASVLPRITDLVATAGEGSWLIDADGKRYLDFSCGIAVTNVGHCHPRVVAAVQEQAATLMHTSVVAHHPRSIELAERLGRLTPFFDEPQVFFCNSGAEAVDGSIKLARRVTGRPGIISFRGGFHGRTIGGTSLTTTKTIYRESYDPLLPGVRVAPYGNDDDALRVLDLILSSEAPAADVAAMIVEPVLGEGGYIVPPVEWLQGLRERCDRSGILLVFDEVQCGMGRTGRPFAAETFGVAPDVLLFAKGVASGMPLGGIIAERRLFNQWPTGAHGSTFGGNPVACAAALATLDVMEDEALFDRAAVMGERLMAELRAATAGNPAVIEVRGVGLMIGVELVDADVANAVQQSCLAAGLIILTTGPKGNVIRLIPPLNLTDQEAAHGMGILCAALASAGQ